MAFVCCYKSVKIMGSLDERMKDMPRVSAEVGESVVIETTKNGIVISEVICYVEQLSFNMRDKTSSVKLMCYNPRSDGHKLITGYEF